MLSVNCKFLSRNEGCRDRIVIREETDGLGDGEFEGAVLCVVGVTGVESEEEDVGTGEGASMRESTSIKVGGTRPVSV